MNGDVIVLLVLLALTGLTWWLLQGERVRR